VNWSTYNQSLVRRGELVIAFDVINNWDTELKEMNKKIKLESHFLILIHFYFYLVMMPRHTFICHIDRQRVLHKRGHAKGKLPSIPDFTTINIEE